jgi:hypothetical protein
MLRSGIREARKTIAFPAFNMHLYLRHGTKNVRKVHILSSHYFYSTKSRSGRHQ